MNHRKYRAEEHSQVAALANICGLDEEAIRLHTGHLRDYWYFEHAGHIVRQSLAGGWTVLDRSSGNRVHCQTRQEVASYLWSVKETGNWLEAANRQP